MRTLQWVLNCMEYYTTIDELLNSISDVLLRVLLIVQQLLQENRHGSKRDIYYMHPSVFSGKSELSFSPNFKWYFFLYSSFPITVIGIWKMHVQWNKFEYLPLKVTSFIAFLNIFCLFCNPEQSVVDRAINDICILMQCSRHNLNVVGVFLMLSFSPEYC